MRTNHQLARLKAHSLGNIAVFGNHPENGIFSKVNTFGGVPKAVKARRIYNNRSAAVVAQRDALTDNFVTPGAPVMPPQPNPVMPPQPNTSQSSMVYYRDSLDDNFVTPQPGRPTSLPAAQQSAARSYVDAIRADLFDADNPLIGGEADTTLVGKPLLTYQEWDAGNPPPRSDSEAIGRQNAYDAYKTAWTNSNSTSSTLGAGPASAAYFGDDPRMVRKEGGIMNSITTFGNADNGEEDDHPSHLPQYLAGSGGTALMLALGYFALKWTRRI